MRAGNETTMKIKNFHLIGIASLALLFAGCETTGQNHGTTANAPTAAPTQKRFAVYYMATDARRIKIGESRPATNGLSFKDPHMDTCWIADDFNFKDFDTLLILPTRSTVTVETNAVDNFELAKENVAEEIKRQFEHAGLFPNIVTSKSDVKPGAKVLVMENTITEFKMGSGSARFWAGSFGAGQPVTRVATKITDGDRLVFACEARRSGVSAEARVLLPSNDKIQSQDIHSLVLDLTDFAAVMEGKYQPVQ
jgi:hypothetical protein